MGLRNRDTLNSWKHYLDYAEDFCEPINPAIDVFLRYDLYLSKIVFLRNLQKKCFLSANSDLTQEAPLEELAIMREALLLTEDHIRNVVLEALNLSLSHLSQKSRVE